jgi:starch phosphorylase
VPQSRQLQQAGTYQPREIYERDPRVRRVLEALRDSRFCPRSPGQHAWVWDKLLAVREMHFHLADLPSYLDVQDEVAGLYRHPTAWRAKAILNVARSARFSSDRTIREYAQDIWQMTPLG